MADKNQNRNQMTNDTTSRSGGGSGTPDPEETSGPPANIVGAWQAWLVACGLQAVVGVVTMVVSMMDPGAVLSQAENGFFTAQYAELTDSQLDSVAQSAAVVAMVLNLLFTLGFVWLAFRMRAGRAWARLILVAGSIYLAISAVLLFFGGLPPGFDAAPTWLQLVFAGLTIGAACAAMAGVILTSGQDGISWFGTKGGNSGGTDKNEQEAKRNQK